MLIIQSFSNSMLGTMKAALLLLLLASTCFAKKPENLEWKTGTLLDQSSERQCRTSGTVYQGNGSVDEICRTQTLFTVESGDMVYTLQRTTRRRDKPLNVTVNAQVKYALVGDKAYLQDESGESHEVTMVKKELKKKPVAQ
jgi:hypothetical protein